MIQVPFNRRKNLSPGTYQFRPVAWFALSATVGILYFVVAVVALHVLRPELNPVKHAVSNYAIGPFGFLMISAFFGLALSAFALALGFARSLAPTRQARVSVLLLSLTGMGLAMTAIFPGDVTSPHPPGTTTALIHWLAAGTSFLSLMIATFLLSSAYKTDIRWQSFHHLSLTFAVINVLALAVFGVLTLAGWIGIGERIYLGACMVWLLLASVRLLLIG